MIKWKRIVNESIDEKSFKKLLRQNGVTKLPAGTKMSYDGKLQWSKHKGYAGQKTIRNMCIQLEHAGWKRGDWTTGGTPDGSSVANSNSYTSPDGRILMSYTEYYGCTSYDNSFYITFKLVESGVNESTIKGAGRVVFEDDLVAVYTPDGKLEYKGLFDYCPYKDDDMRYDKTTMTYRIEGSNGDYRTMAKLAESSMVDGRLVKEENSSGKPKFKRGDEVLYFDTSWNYDQCEVVGVYRNGNEFNYELEGIGISRSYEYAFEEQMLPFPEEKAVEVLEKRIGTNEETDIDKDILSLLKNVLKKREMTHVSSYKTGRSDYGSDDVNDKPESIYMRSGKYGSPNWTGD